MSHGKPDGIRDITVKITYFDDFQNPDKDWTRDEEHWINEFDYRQYIHMNSDRIRKLEVLTW